MANETQTIKSSIDIVEYIGKTVQLKKKGSTYRGATSTTSKSGESLIVDQVQQVYNNFADNDGGDIYNWIAYVEGLDVETEFPRILSIAAEYAGVTLEHQHTEDITDKKQLYPLMADVAEFYHGQLTDDCRQYIKTTWGISDQMIDELKIGWAAGSNELLLQMRKKYSVDVLSKSGLFYVINGTKPGNDFFQNRIMFPYWKGGKPVYFIGRDPYWKTGANGPKYKKQMVHSNHAHVSPVVDNSVFYGEDSIKRTDSVIITEGVTDCIRVLQEGLPCISPVTIQIKEEQKETAYQLVKNKDEVIICNDNEDNESGKKGAIATAEYLESKGVAVRVVELPRQEGVNKIDLAEYLQDHTKEDFEQLPANNVWEIKLNLQDVPIGTVDKTRALQRFIQSELKQMEPASRDMFVRNEVREYFNVSKREIGKILKSVVWHDDIQDEADVNFFTDSGRLRTKKLGEYVMSVARFITFDDNKVIYVYKHGVYVPHGEDLISRIVQNALGDDSKKNHIAEIINYVQLETMVPRSKINHDVYKINILNGLYNLKSGQLEPHTPEYISIVQLPINYDVQATCPNIVDFVSQVLQEVHHDVIYEIIAYCMVPDTRIEKSTMFLGKGANGKSVMLSLISTFLGSKNVSAESLHALETDTYSIAELYGKLANIFPDLASKAIYENSTFKMLSGNEHEMRARRIYEKPFKFKNTARLIFSANNLPPAPKGDYAYYRRWMPIMFPYTFEGDDADKNLIDKITTEQELSGLFNKCVSILPRLLEECTYSYDLTTDEVEVLYKVNSDPIAAFADEMVIYSEYDTPKAVMFQEYIGWCNMNDIEPVADNAFARRFIKLGYEAGREATGNRTRVWENCVVTEIRPGFDNKPGRNLDESKTLSSNTIGNNPSRLLNEKDHCYVEQKIKNMNNENKNYMYSNNRENHTETWTDLDDVTRLQSVLTRPGLSGLNPETWTMGEKMDIFREICKNFNKIDEIIKITNEINFTDAAEIMERMMQTGEIMAVGENKIRLV